MWQLVRKRLISLQDRGPNNIIQKEVLWWCMFFFSLYLSFSYHIFLLMKINISEKLLRCTACCDKYCGISFATLKRKNQIIWTLAVNRDTLLRLPHWPGVSMVTGKHASPQQPDWSVSNSVWQPLREETRSETHKHQVILDYFAPAFP